MSDPLPSRPAAPLLATGASLGLAGSGILAFGLGAFYHYYADVVTIYTAGQFLILSPIAIAFAYFFEVCRHRRRRWIVLMAIFSTIGLAFMLLSSSWGEGILHAPPAWMRKYHQYTYASDLLFCFAHAMELISAVLILATGNGGRGGRQLNGASATSPHSPAPFLGRIEGPSLVIGASLGLAGSGILAFGLGAFYHYDAYRVTIGEVVRLRDFGQLLMLIPLGIASAYFAELWRHRRRRWIVLMAVFSVIGVALMLLRSSWGGGIVDASPAWTRKFNQSTYASDLLFCFAHAMELFSAVLILATGNDRRGVRERRADR